MVTILIVLAILFFGLPLVPGILDIAAEIWPVLLIAVMFYIAL